MIRRRAWGSLGWTLLLTIGCNGLPRSIGTGATVDYPIPSTADPLVAPFLAAFRPDTASRIGVALRIAEVEAAAPESASAPVATELDPALVHSLLDELLGPASAPALVSPFRFATRSLPAPRPGFTTVGALGAPGSALLTNAPRATSTKEPLRVLRASPRGLIARASQVAITFSRPMARLAAVQAAPAGVRLLPETDGEWRWLDPSTLVFESSTQLPGSTRYSVEVPAGIAAVDGGVLSSSADWTFATSPAAIREAVALEAPQLSRPIIAVVFDQRVDPAAVLPFLELTVDSVTIPIQLATDAEQQLPAVRYRLPAAAVGRRVAIRPRVALPRSGTDAESRAVLRVLPGLPSLEGPVTVAEATEHSFLIRKALQVVAHGCGRSAVCAPGVPWTIRFNQMLRAAPDSGSWVQVEPELPGATVEVWQNHIVVLGSPAPNTTYTVRLNPAITTWAGDSLGDSPRLRFEIAKPLPSVWAPGGGIAYVPSNAPARYTVLAEGADSVRVEVRAVSTDDWGTYQRIADEIRGTGRNRSTRPGRVVSSAVLPLTAAHSGTSEAVVNLARAFEASDHLLLAVEAVAGDRSADAESPASALTWIERGATMLDVAADAEALTVHATSVVTGQGQAGVSIDLLGGPSVSGQPLRPLASATTDDNGLAVLSVSKELRGWYWVIRATRDQKTVLFANVAPGQMACCDPWEWAPALRSHFVTNRPIHSPGDTVKFAGWLRRISGAGHPLLLPQSGATVSYAVNDPRGQTLATGVLQVAENGRVAGQVVLPPEVNSGNSYVRLTLNEPGGRTVYGGFSFDIQEVRRPDMEVSVQLDPGPHSPGSQLEVALHARYFTGGSLPNAEVNWRVFSAPARYDPPGWPDYSFGWRRYPAAQMLPPYTHAGRTRQTGEHRLVLSIDSVIPSIPMLLHAEATVVDVDRQRRTASNRVIVHPAAVYVGLRTNARFIRVGDVLSVDLLVVDIDGRPVPGRKVAVRALRQDRTLESGMLEISESQRAGCVLESRPKPVSCRVANLPTGDYMLAAVVEDQSGRRSLTELPFRVAGEGIPSGARAARDSVAVVPQQNEYAVGDTAVVLIQATFPATAAVFTARRAGVLDTRTVHLATSQATIRLPITEAHVPNLQLHVLAAAADGVLVSGTADVVVAPRTRALNVNVSPLAAVVAPGTKTTVTVVVTDHAGRPVPDANVVLSGVDESLYALSYRPAGDPIKEFYTRSNAAVVDRTLRAHLAPRQLLNTPRNGRGQITGVAIDGMTGQPIARAWVQLSGATGAGAWTSLDGSYRLTGVAPGVHDLQARATGYVTGHVSKVNVAGGQSRAHFVLLTRNAVLAGRRSGGGAFQAARFEEGALALNEVVVSAAKVADAPQATAVAVVPAPAARSAPTQGASSERPLLRADFSAVAVFVVDARTGPDGRVEIPVKVPDNLTRYRLRAVVAEGSRRFGVGEGALTARLLLMARLKPPRFLHRGDQFELPVILENRADAAMDVNVTIRASNAVIGNRAGRRITIPAGDRVEVRFPAVAGEPGSARFQVAAAPVNPGQASADAAEALIPVLLPAVTEAFAVYGELDDATPVAFPLQLPKALPGHANVEVGYSTTAAHGLGDALLFLFQCFYDLPEVLASRILALSALRDTPAALPFAREAIDAAIRNDVTRLSRLQLYDGGWSLWTARFDADPFVSVHATHALLRAKNAGVPVSERTLSAATRWLEQRDEHAPRDTLRRASQPPNARLFPVDYPKPARHAVQAYALDVRRRLGHDVSASASALVEESTVGALSAEALAWLLPALSAKSAFARNADDVRRELDSRIVRSAGTAALVSPYDAGGREMFYSARRTDAIVLSSLLEVGALPELSAALARGLLAHRVKGRWSNTQENAYAVLALAGYLATAEAKEPNLVARAWAGSRLAGERAFRGRSDERHELRIPADSLGRSSEKLEVIVAREGAGRLYYRVGLSYALEAPAVPLARGFAVEHSYEAVDQPSDVRRDADGTWRVRLGARVRVRIAVTTVGPRYHVAVVDPIPAGLEAVNAALAGNEGLRAPGSPTLSTGPRAAWFPVQHLNVRADRLEAFTTLLLPGQYELSYLALATTPGNFAAPPTRAEEMYAPETFGRGGAARLIVEAKPGETRAR